VITASLLGLFTLTETGLAGCWWLDSTLPTARLLLFGKIASVSGFTNSSAIVGTKPVTWALGLGAASACETHPLLGRGWCLQNRGAG